jgi:aminoglycoside phosphotransferase (APT) family kinase protein
MYPLVPLHGVFSPHNIIVGTKDGDACVMRIIDFERARIGDRVWDLVYLYGRLQILDEQIAQSWKSVFWNELTADEQKRFDLYWFLFHAWTVRDGIADRTNEMRYIRGEKALRLLQSRVAS